MIGKNIPPGLNREFAAESWPLMPKKLWDTQRDEAKKNIKDTPLNVFASDINKKAVQIAMVNAERCNLKDVIVFQKKPLNEFSSKNTMAV